MVGKLNSPGILVREVDNTAFAPTIDSSIVGIVGFADKGPIDKATLITNAEQLIKTFGEPSEDLPGQGLIGALEILEATNRIYFVRAASDAGYASSLVSLGVCPTVAVDKSLITTANDIYFTIQFKEGTEILGTLNTMMSLTEETFGENFSKYLGDGTASKDLFAGSYDPTDPNIGYIYGSYAGKNMVLGVSAYSNPARTTGIACLKNVNEMGNLVGAGVSTIAASGYDITTSDLNYTVKSLWPGKGYNYGISLKTGEVTGVSVEMEPLAGPFFNIYVNDKGYINETFRVSLVGDNTFLGNVIKESDQDSPLFSDFILGSFEGTANPQLKNPLLTPAQKLTTLLEYSTSDISLVQGTTESASGNPRFIKPKVGTFKLQGGTNGVSDDTSIFGGITAAEGTSEDGTDDNLNSVVIGTPADKTGIYALDDDNLNISIVAVPGFTNQRIQNALITLAESSQNFIAAVSPPYGLDTTQEAVNWMNGKSSTRTASINSSYVAVYWPWTQVFSVYDERDRWLDPAIYAVRQMAFTDSVAEPWFAPAGFNRGRLTKPLDTEIILSQGDRDTLYDNNINPVVKFFPEGITIFGQKTGKRVPSATDRINVRRLMIVLRKTLLASARGFVFEPNDALTWENVKTLCEDILRDFAARRGVAEYRVICDSTINTPLRVSRRELWCKIILRPVEAAEYIIFEVNLTNNTSKLGA